MCSIIPVARRPILFYFFNRDAGNIKTNSDYKRKNEYIFRRHSGIFNGLNIQQFY